MIEKGKIFCVIPAWNEEKNIGQVVRDVLNFVDFAIVVDDGSFDKTFDSAKNAGAVVLRLPINRDQGSALRTGSKLALSLSKSEKDIIIHFDADGQMRAKDIPEVIEPLQDGTADIVFGSRFFNKETKMPFFKKNALMPLARFVNMLLGNVRLTDPQSGFRAMTVKTARLLKWKQDGKAHCSEILFLAHKLNLRIKERAITVLYNRFGQKFSGGLAIVKDLLIAKIIN